MTEPEIIGHLDAANRIYQAAADDQLVREASSGGGDRDCLMRALGFEEGLERALARADPSDGDLHAPSKSPVIAGDVVALGMMPGEALALPAYDIAGRIRAPGMV